MKKWFKALIIMYKGLPKEVYIIFITTIINRLGGFVNVFLTIFLTQKLGMSFEKAGFYISLSGAASLIGIILGGHLGDFFGRKRVYVIAQSIAAFLFIPCGFLGNSYIVPFLLIMSAFFSSIVHPISGTMITDLVDKNDRKRAFSLLYFGINVGVAIGPIIAAYLFYHYIQWLFWGDALTTFIAVILIIKYIPETKLSYSEITEVNYELDEQEKIETGGTLIAFLKRPVLIFFTFANILTSFVYAQSNFALPVTMTNIFGEKLGTVLFGNLMSFNAIVVIVFTIIVTKVTDKIKPIFNIAFSNILYAIGFGMMAFVYNMPFIVLSVYLWTIGEILGATNSGVFIAGHTPISHRSRFNAIIAFLRNIGHMLGPAIGGIIINKYSMNGLWILTIVLSVIAFFLMIIIGFKDKSEPYKVESVVEVV